MMVQMFVARQNGSEKKDNQAKLKGYLLWYKKYLAETKESHVISLDQAVKCSEYVCHLRATVITQLAINFEQFCSIDVVSLPDKMFGV